MTVTPIDVFTSRFRSDDSTNGPGFQLEYSANDASESSYIIGACGGSLTTPNGTLTSPFYPDSYPDNADCVYTISQPNGTVIVLTIHSMDIEDICTSTSLLDVSWLSDYLEIRDGSSAASPLLGKLCGKEIPAPIQSTQNQVWMK